MPAMNDVQKKGHLWAAGAKALVEIEKRDRPAGVGRRSRVVGTSLPTTDGPARNAPCPCGSGLKFKRCCGK